MEPTTYVDQRGYAFALVAGQPRYLARCHPVPVLVVNGWPHCTDCYEAQELALGWTPIPQPGQPTGTAVSC